MSNKNIEEIGKIPAISIRVFAVLIIIFGFLVFRYYLSEPELQDIQRKNQNHIITVLGGFIGLYGAIYIKYDFDEKRKQSKLEKSYEAINKLCDHKYVEVRKFIEDEYDKQNFTGNPKEIDQQLQKYINENPKIHNNIHLILGLFESLSVQVKIGYIDERVLFEHCCYMFINFYGKLQNYIILERKTLGETLSLSNELYKHAEDLYKAWSENRSLYDGKEIKRI